MKNFGISGVAGYIAPRHLKAIKDTGNRLVAALDTHDSVGILDRFFPGASFFTEFERFDRHLEMLRREASLDRMDYLSICSPNYLHDAHIRLALRLGAHAICEKPLVIKPWNLDALRALEHETSCRVYTVLQLRLHPKLIELKNSLAHEDQNKIYDVCLTYITSRGKWYLYSWKGGVERSGGLATNIGIHFFDLLIWLFGPVKYSILHFSSQQRVAGYLELSRARIRWFLSINNEDLPEKTRKEEKSTYRSIQINGSEIEFTDGFTDLHTRVYEEVLAGRGFTIEDAKPSIEMTYNLQNQRQNFQDGLLHPLTESICSRTERK